jgi:nitrite reductase/ring-hydroxylating ferredoxin subunit
MAAVEHEQTAISTFNAAGIGAGSDRIVQSETLGVNDVAVSMEDYDCGAAVPGLPLPAPYPADFPRNPQSWFVVCASTALPKGTAKRITLCGRSLVLFRGRGGQVGAQAGHCPHLGTDLTAGRVVDDDIECPHHRFRFDRSGVCHQHDLRNTAYPVEERFGAIFVFLAAKAAFPLPSFGDDTLINAAPFTWRLNTQWYMIGANGFDARHLPFAHGRRLVAEPRLRVASRYCLEITYEYAIDGDGWLDRATRWVSGSRVEFDIAAWNGCLLLVRARFARDQTFGVVSVEPVGEHACTVTVIVNAQRSGMMLGAWLKDWLRLQAKRIAVRSFLRGDLRLQGMDYVAGGLRAGDETLAAFLRWAAAVPEGQEPRSTTSR